jgi:hypothetical protein
MPELLGRALQYLVAAPGAVLLVVQYLARLGNALLVLAQVAWALRSYVRSRRESSASKEKPPA